MSLRQRSFQFVENNSNYVVHVTRGQERRRYEISRLALFGGAALLSLVGAAVIAAAGYLVFRDDLLAGLIERQTQMQYAYEDRLAAARLRLDQVASRQFIDSDGVEGKVRSLVIRQAMLETRAAVVARLLEHTVQNVTGSIGASRILSAPAPGLAAGILAQPRATQSAIDDSAASLDGKPRPENFDLRPGQSRALRPLAGDQLMTHGLSNPAPAARARITRRSPSQVPRPSQAPQPRQVRRWPTPRTPACPCRRGSKASPCRSITSSEIRRPGCPASSSPRSTPPENYAAPSMSLACRWSDTWRRGKRAARLRPLAAPSCRRI